MLSGLRERLFALEQFGIKLGLDNITTLLEALHRPDSAFRTVHVAGTNGKGSVTAMVERGLRAAGHRTGRYTSPHLCHIEERVVIDGADVAPTAFDEATATVLGLADRLIEGGMLAHPPTFFEATTAIAFELFRRQRVEVAVVEVGLGGRYDATNVIDPALTAITSIALDHQRHLGSTLEAIAFEKAGIIKPGIPVIIGPMPAEARTVIVERAMDCGAPVHEVVASTKGVGTPLTLALAGGHQHQNAAVAVEILRQCHRRGISVRPEHVVAALTDVEWPARLEWLRVPGRGDVLIDAAHNPAGAQSLADYLHGVTGPLPFVLGVMKDKDVDAIIRTLCPVISRVVATQADSPRALEASALADRLRTLLPSAPVDCRPDPDDALARALERVPRAVVAGSIFLVGPLRHRLLAQGAEPVRYPSNTDVFYLT